MNPKDGINSRAWWEAYFDAEWERHGGPDQTRHFMQRLIEELPELDRALIAEQSWSILDWGCAFGDGAAELARAFPQAQVAGLEFSTNALARARQRYPQHEFLQRADSAPVGTLPRTFDIVVNSNSLEHFTQPLDVLRANLAGTRMLHVSLVPYREDPLSVHHVAVFDDDTFPHSIGGFRRVVSKVIGVERGFWPSGRQLLTAYASVEYARMRAAFEPRFTEQQKWDRYYSDLPLDEIDPLTRAFGEELVAVVRELLPSHGCILEAGCGGGQQSLALARAGFDVTLLDFSRHALDYARRLFEREGVIATRIQADAFECGEPEYDLVFNAGVLEHYDLAEQARYLRGMASRSRKYVLVLIPNRACYWYWVWRIKKEVVADWPFGKEVPQTALADAFRAAGLEHLGECYLGASWSEYFIESTSGIEPELKRLLLEIHRSPIAPAMAKGYLTAALGRVRGTSGETPGRWRSAPSAIDEIRSEEKWTALLADALAGKIAADERARDVPRLVDERAKAQTELTKAGYELARAHDDLTKARQDLSKSHEEISLLQTRLGQAQSDHDSTKSLLAATRSETDAAQATAAELRSHLHRIASELNSIRASRGYRMLQWLYRIRLRLLPRGSRRENAARTVWRFARALRNRVRASRARPGMGESGGLRQRIEHAAGTGPGITTFDLTDYAPRLSRHAVIVLPIIEWGFRFQRPQQIARQFARAGHPVLFASHKFGGAVVTRELEMNVTEVDLPGRSGMNPYRERIDASSAQVMARAIVDWMRRRSLGHSICVIELPFWAPVAEELRRELGCPIVYDCMDDHGGFSSNTPEMLAAERGLLAAADLTIVSSQLLLENVGPAARKTMLVRNAADYSHFAALVRSPRSAQRNVVVGYYGAIADWFDSSLVGELATLRPDWQFDLIGDTWSADLIPLQARANIRLPGEAPYKTLPDAMRDWDCCIIPFRRMPLTEATNPVKVYEMLAAGLPVVAVDLPELRPIAARGLISIANTPAEFAAAIESSIAGDCEVLIDKRREFALANTWEVRFRDFEAGVRSITPLVSIIVVTFNNLELNRLCLSSLLRDTDYPNFEVIVVDNGSNDGTPDLLREMTAHDRRVRIELNADNRGFAGGNNQGVALARGEYICLLNNDTVVTGSWLSTLVRHLQADPKVGIIGPATNATSNEAKIDVEYRRLVDLPIWADRWCGEHRGQLVDTKMLAFFCVVLSRRLWNEIGTLDERFGKGMFEDDDYCRRVLAAGYSLRIAFDSYVHHWQRASFIKLGEAEYFRTYYENQRRYRRKWDERHAPSSEQSAKLQPIFESAKRSKGVIVFPPSVGWAIDLFQRPQHIARAAARDGYTVVYDCSTGPDQVDVASEIEPRLYLFRGDLEWLAALQNVILWTFPYNYGYRDLFPGKARVVYDWIDDLDIFPYDQEELARIHERALRDTDVVCCVALPLHLKAREVRPDAIYLPNAAEVERFEREPIPNPARTDATFAALLTSGKPIAGYYGALANWFDYELLKAAARLRPDWNFVLIGPDHDGSLKRANLGALENVHWLGPRNYHDLPGYLGLFDVALVIRVSNGITRAMSPLKLYEYFGGRKPVISTPVPECEEFPEVRIVHNAEELASALDPARADGRDPAFIARLARLAGANTWAVRLDSALSALGPAPGSNAPEDIVKRKMRHLWRPENRYFFDALAKHLSALADDPCLRMYFEFSLSANERGRQLAALLKMHTSLNGRDVLDVGCASGGFLIAFGESGARPVGVDVNPLLLALAKANFRDAGAEYPVLERDVTDPAQVAEFREAFDIVTCNDVLEHVRDPAGAIRNIASVLRQGGLAYFEIPNRDAASAVESDGHYQLFGITQLARDEAESYFRAVNPNTPYGVEHYLRLEEYRRLFESAGMGLEVLPETTAGISIDAARQTVAKIRESIDIKLAQAPEKYRDRLRTAVVDYLQDAESALAVLPANQEEFILRFASPFWRILARRSADAEQRGPSDYRGDMPRAIGRNPRSR